MRRLIVVGAGGHGRSVAEAVLASSQFELTGFLDDSFPGLAKVWDFPVLGTTADIFRCRAFTEAAVVAIGKNELREVLCDQVLLAGFELATVLHPSATISPRAALGEGCTIMAGATVGTEAQLGKGVIVNSGAVVDHHCRVDDFGHLGVHAAMAGGSVLGRGAWMQAGSALGYGVNIGAGVVLAPGVGVSQC